MSAWVISLAELWLSDKTRRGMLGSGGMQIESSLWAFSGVSLPN